MRKKIFIIHGKGERDGIGKNGGGDLDTISSNVFYGAWAEATVRAEKGAPAVYGEDYEFDFVNYQQGLSHLACHRGADLYLPDFPIDALAPRLRLQRIVNPCEITVRTMLADAVANLYPTAFAYRQWLTPEWKTLVNDLFTKAGAVLEKRTFFEIGMMSFGLFYTVEAIIARAHGDDEARRQVEDLLRGPAYEQWRGSLDALVRNPLKKNVLDSAPQANTRLKLALDESYRADFGILYRNQHGGQLAVTWTEAMAVAANIARLLAEVGAEIMPADRDGLNKIAAGALQLVRSSAQQVRALFTGLAAAYPDLRERFTAAASYETELTKFIDAIPQYVAGEAQPGTTRILRAMLVEEANGRPVAGVPVRFRLQRGPGALALPGAAAGGRSVDAVTGGDGGATVELRLPAADARYEVFATHDDMVVLPYRDLATIYEASGGTDQTGKYEVKSVSSAALSDEVDDEEEGGILDPDLAVAMACRLLERDIRQLRELDIRLIRLDDHHPWTPRIHETLQRLKGEGLIGEIQLSSLQRGEEQPKEVQKCGADLIYDTFLAGKPGDNPGLALLRELAHVQDLHIRVDDLAIDLSKLLGSKVDKIAMTRGLMTVQSAADLKSIMQRMGWAQRVADYEAGLEKVCPRLDATVSCLHFLLPPEGGDYGRHLGWKSMLKPLVGIGKSEADKQHEVKRLYAEKPGNRVCIFTALSPFCDGKKGEPQINVASAIQYFSKRYSPDYFFYNYGGQLMTTRRVNGESYKIDLNQVVATIGSKADGGHAEAATGKPMSNPSFPLHRFSDVKDKNYQEFLVYIAGKVQALTGLELYRVGPVRAKGVAPAVLQVAARAARCCQLITVGDKTILLALHAYGETGEPEVGLPQIYDYLSGVTAFDYLFYAYAGNQLVLINHNDPGRTLALDALARRIGTYRDGGSPVAADCVPKYCPTWPVQAFKYVNSRAFALYAGYLTDILRELYPGLPVTVTAPPLPLDDKIMQVAPRLEKNMANLDFHTAADVSPRSHWRALASLAPFTDRKKNEPDLSAATAMVYLRSTGKNFTHYLYCESSYRLTLVAGSDTPRLDLPALAEKIPGREKQVFGNVLSLVPEVPPAIGKVNYKNFKDYLAWLAGFIGSVSGHGIHTVAPLE